MAGRAIERSSSCSSSGDDGCPKAQLEILTFMRTLESTSGEHLTEAAKEISAAWFWRDPLRVAIASLVSRTSITATMLTMAKPS